ncbi:MAG: chemotaxis protein [Chlorobi bacterium]|nr:chemotaxis protein [Chlorobiota bacterium]
MHNQHAVEWMNEIESRSRLAGSNMMEVLLFHIGTRELFGINVFKVREVLRAPKITPLPHAPGCVRGVVSLRGSILPVLSIRDILDHPRSSEHETTLIVTEYSRHLQAFIVAHVERIVRVPWDIVHPPTQSIASTNSYLSALFRWEEQIVSLLDVEQILAGVVELPTLTDMIEKLNGSASVLFADDSPLARKEIVRVLERMGVRYHQAATGTEAWFKLQGIAENAANDGRSTHSLLNAILLDIEMPEMDGYTLAQKIKADSRFNGIPIIMHSSLSSNTNKTTGFRAGADFYVAKFDPVELAQTIRKALSITGG